MIHSGNHYKSSESDVWRILIDSLKFSLSLYAHFLVKLGTRIGSSRGYPNLKLFFTSDGIRIGIGIRVGSSLWQSEIRCWIHNWSQKGIKTRIGRIPSSWFVLMLMTSGFTCSFLCTNYSGSDSASDSDKSENQALNHQKEMCMYYIHSMSLTSRLQNKLTIYILPVLLQIYDQSPVTRYQEELCHLYDIPYEVRMSW